MKALRQAIQDEKDERRRAEHRLQVDLWRQREALNVQMMERLKQAKTNFLDITAEMLDSTVHRTMLDNHKCARADRSNARPHGRRGCSWPVRLSHAPWVRPAHAQSEGRAFLPVVAPRVAHARQHGLRLRVVHVQLPPRASDRKHDVRAAR